MPGELALRFSERDWERVERAWSAWWAGELDRPLIVLDNYEPGRPDPALRLPPGGRPVYFPLEMPAEELVDIYGALLECTRWYGDVWPKWWPDFGAGVAAAFLRASMKLAPETVWFEPLDPGPIQALQLVPRPHLYAPERLRLYDLPAHVRALCAA